MRTQTDGHRVRGMKVRHNGGRGSLAGTSEWRWEGSAAPVGRSGALRAPGAVSAEALRLPRSGNRTEAGVTRAEQSGAGRPSV